MLPTTLPRRAISSGVVTTMSLLTVRSPKARLISTAARRLSSTSSMTTSRSTSLQRLSVPRARAEEQDARGLEAGDNALYYSIDDGLVGHCAPPDWLGKVACTAELTAERQADDIRPTLYQGIISQGSLGAAFLFVDAVGQLAGARGLYLSPQLRSPLLAALSTPAEQIMHHLPDSASAASSYTRG